MHVLAHYLRWAVGLGSAQTQTTEAERACLARLASGRVRVVEVGVWHGVTTHCIREVIAPDGVIIAVDPFPRGRLGVSLHERIARAEAARARNGRIWWWRMTGAEAAAQYAASGEPPVDLVFIDGDHEYGAVRADWEGWSPLVASGGLIALHDSRPTARCPMVDRGSVQFTGEVVLHDPRFELAETVDSLTAVRRRSWT
jgi:predicted O-methyltransferase YrrM